MQKLLLHNRDQQIIQALDFNNKDIDSKYREEKFEKMSANPYYFFRGSNHLYWEDFYNDWRINFFGGTEETLTWINGDAHIYNYGAYANHEGEAIFCMDDFDDAVIADFQFDLWRMAVSIVLDCREQQVFDKKVQQKAVREFAKSYRKQLSKHHKDDTKNEFHMNVSNAKGIMKSFLKKVEKNKSRDRMLNKWTAIENERRIFDYSNPKLCAIEEEVRVNLVKSLNQYQNTLHSDLDSIPERFKVKDIAARVRAGTGSLGSERYYALLEGDTEGLHDDVILDIKEQSKPPLYDHMDEEEQAEFDRIFPDQAERHSYAFQALAEHPDKYLGWLQFRGKSFSVRERSPYKCDFDTRKCTRKKELLFMANLWGDVLASRHKRASYVLNERAHTMPEAFNSRISRHEDEFDDLVTSIAFQYADCVKQDYKYFLKMLDNQQ